MDLVKFKRKEMPFFTFYLIDISIIIFMFFFHTISYISVKKKNYMPLNNRYVCYMNYIILTSSIDLSCNTTGCKERSIISSFPSGTSFTPSTIPIRPTNRYQLQNQRQVCIWPLFHIVQIRGKINSNEYFWTG